MSGLNDLARQLGLTEKDKQRLLKSEQLLKTAKTAFETLKECGKDCDSQIEDCESCLADVERINGVFFNELQQQPGIDN